MIKLLDRTANKVAAVLLSLLLTLTMIPGITFADDISDEEDNTEYGVCFAEKDSETGGSVLCSADNEFDAFDGYIGMETELVLAVRENRQADWREVTPEEAALFTVNWSADDMSAVEFKGDTENRTKVTFRALKEKKKKPVKITAVLTFETPEDQEEVLPEEEPGDNGENKEASSDEDPDVTTVTEDFYVYIYDGYNPGFDPDNEDEVMELIDSRIREGKCRDLKDGRINTDEITENDGVAVFRFKPEKSRYYTFESLGDLHTYGYLFEYNDDTTDGSSKSCTLLAENDGGGTDSNFLITGGQDYEEGQYEYPLDTYESVTYYVIAKFYKSSVTGPVSVSCSRVKTVGIFDSRVRYTVGDTDEDENEIVEEVEFDSSAASQEYVYNMIVPHDIRWDRDVLISYTDSTDRQKLRSLKPGRNVVATTGKNRYVLNITCEKKDDRLFDVGICRYTSDKDDVLWEGEDISHLDFSESGEAELKIPRNSEGLSFTVLVEGQVSSFVKANDEDEADWRKEISFEYSEENSRVSFLVSTADQSGTEEDVWKEYTVNIVEDDGFELDEVFVDFAFDDIESGKRFAVSGMIENDDIDESGNMTIYIPYWYRPGEKNFFDVDIMMKGDDVYDSDEPSEINTVTTFSISDLKSVIDSAVSEGTEKTYSFTMADKVNPEKYSKEYIVRAVPTDGKKTALKKAYIRWTDPDSDEIMKKYIDFIAGSGTKKNPYAASVRLPSGVSLMNLGYEISLMAFSDRCGILYSEYFGEYEREDAYMDCFLNGESKAETINFMLKSADGSKKTYYTVNVVDSDKAFKKGTVFTSNGAVYRVTKTGSKAEAEYLKADKNTVSESIPSKLKGGITNYKVTAVSQKAFAGCKKLSSVTIGEKVGKIGSKAFYGDKKLKTLKIKSGVLTKKGVKSSLKGSSVKTVKCIGKAAKKTKVYKKYFIRKNCGKTVKIK